VESNVRSFITRQHLLARSDDGVTAWLFFGVKRKYHCSGKYRVNSMSWVKEYLEEENEGCSSVTEALKYVRS
jgi:hypothetical protein